MLWLEGCGTGAQACRLTPVFHPYQLTLVQDTCTCNGVKYFVCPYSPFPGLSSVPGFSPYPSCSSLEENTLSACLVCCLQESSGSCLLVGPPCNSPASISLQCLFSLVCCPGLPEPVVASPGATAGTTQCSGSLFPSDFLGSLQRMSLGLFSQI